MIKNKFINILANPGISLTDLRDLWREVNPGAPLPDPVEGRNTGVALGLILELAKIVQVEARKE